ncbi:MAG: L-aspartate oxidase [Planctomycetes bacterium]|nr:L-aspartate oxidase [Planctomycetota bacterium]
MANLFDTRRYLTNFDAVHTSHIVTDCLVIGSGVAGARAAVEAANYCHVILLCKGAFTDSNTSFAQGGIAVAKGDPASFETHFEDTMRVGCGLNDPQAVRTLVEEGPSRIAELIEWGIEFDREAGELAYGLEGGHSVHRIVHAHGDETGRELTRILARRVRGTRRLRVFEHCFLIDLLTDDGRCLGAVTYHEEFGHQLIWAKQTVLATGGCGQIWRESTNPPITTGDGLAAAIRAGAILRDMEMMQFHPTTLYVAGAGRALISEAVRGEGAYLIDREGNRFMLGKHHDAELAPRDVVSRAIHEHLAATHSNCAYLDVRHIPNFATRFPGITRLCADFQIDVHRDLIPVRPSAHYLVGGVEVELNGQSSVDRLFCCGEVASNGVHGANRLASNSLLEGLVFGKIVGESAGRLADGARTVPEIAALSSHIADSLRTPLDIVDVNNSLRSLMTRNVGVVRSGERLTETAEILDFWGHYTLDKTFDSPSGWELQNKLTVAKACAASALARTESIGVHFRSDADSHGSASLYHTQIARDFAEAQRVTKPPPFVKGGSRGVN